MHGDSEEVFSPPAVGDRLAGLSPPPKGKLLPLTAVEFLKFFQPDGSGVAENRVQINFKPMLCATGKLMRHVTGDPPDKFMPWPRCKDFAGFDVYYNSPNQEEIETASDRLKSRLHKHETSSTCITRQINATNVIKLRTSPGRLSVRRVLKRKLDDDTNGKTPISRKINVDRKVSCGGKGSSKSQVSIKSKLRVTAKTPPHDSKEKAEKKEARSLRHKRKLEYVVKETLKAHGIVKTDPVFRPSALCLFNLTKEHLKDLKSYQSLRLEMERITKSNVQMIVDYERQRLVNTKENTDTS